MPCCGPWSRPAASWKGPPPPPIAWAELSRVRLQPEEPVVLTALALSPDRRLLALGEQRRNLAFSLKLFDATTGKELPSAFPTLQTPILSMVFSPDGEQLALSFANQLPPFGAVWEVKSGKTVLVIDQHKRVVDEVQFSPDGPRLA